MRKVELRLLEQNIKLVVTNEVINKLAELGYSPEFGARPLKRTIQQHVIIPVSQYILKNAGTKEIVANLKDDKIIVE